MSIIYYDPPDNKKGRRKMASKYLVSENGVLRQATLNEVLHADPNTIFGECELIKSKIKGFRVYINLSTDKVVLYKDGEYHVAR